MRPRRLSEQLSCCASPTSVVLSNIVKVIRTEMLVEVCVHVIRARNVHFAGLCADDSVVHDALALSHMYLGVKGA